VTAPGSLPRAVLDTSALVPVSLRRGLQEAALYRLYTAIWSPWIIAELNRVLVWRWIKDAPPGVARNDLSGANERYCGEMAKLMMERLIPVFEVVAPVPPYPPPWEGLTDRWDLPILAAAVAGRAQYVVSENTRHFPPRGDDGRHVYEGIEYIRARAFLELIRANRRRGR
jgi:hypothetical protein